MNTAIPLTLLAIDPGQDTGFSVWCSGELADCGVVDPEEPMGRWLPDVVVIEQPKVYMRSKVNPDNIISLARKVGRYEERYCARWGIRARLELFHPGDWKGSIDGDVMMKRIEADLTPAERVVLNGKKIPASIRHNALDAIGLGKWYLTRLRVSARLAAGPLPAAA